MNKREFAKLYIKNGNKDLTILDAVKEIDELLDMIGLELKKEGKVKFTNFCSMDVLDRAERRIADPNTKEPMVIKPPKKVRFYISNSKLKDMN